MTRRKPAFAAMMRLLDRERTRQFRELVAGVGIHAKGRGLTDLGYSSTISTARSEAGCTALSITDTRT